MTARLAEKVQLEKGREIMSDKSKQTSRHPLLKCAVLLTSIAFILSPLSALAETDRITRGDVQSVLEAFQTGGVVVLLRASDTAGLYAAPADLYGSNGAIRPFPQWDGQHLCVDDWHVILLGFFEGGDQSFTIQDADDLLSKWNATFTLVFHGESSVLDTVRTSTRAFLNPDTFGWDKAYGFQQGQIVPAGAFPVGEFTLEAVVEFDGAVRFESSIDFFVDASDSAACTE